MRAHTPTYRRIRRRFLAAVLVMIVCFLQGAWVPWWLDMASRTFVGLWAGTGLCWWIVFPINGDPDGRRGYFRYCYDAYQAVKTDDAASARP